MNQAQYNDWLRQCSHVTAHVPEGAVEDAVPLYCNSGKHSKNNKLTNSFLSISPYIILMILAIFLSGCASDPVQKLYSTQQVSAWKDASGKVHVVGTEKGTKEDQEVTIKTDCRHQKRLGWGGASH